MGVNAYPTLLDREKNMQVGDSQNRPYTRLFFEQYAIIEILKFPIWIERYANFRRFCRGEPWLALRRESKYNRRAKARP